MNCFRGKNDNAKSYNLRFAIMLANTYSFFCEFGWHQSQCNGTITQANQRAYEMSSLVSLINYDVFDLTFKRGQHVLCIHVYIQCNCKNCGVCRVVLELSPSDIG